MQLGQPKVLIKEIDGKKHEPIEALTVHVPDVFSGKVIHPFTFGTFQLDHIVLGHIF